MNFIEELKWRGLIQDIMPGTEEQLKKESTAGYIGFDPTAESLHIGSLVQILLLKRFQLAGHKPIALVGGATGMIGDPSGKKEERKLLTLDEVNHNAASIKNQLGRFLDFGTGSNAAEMVNNADWFQSLSAISFLREAGKHLTTAYLLSKGFVKDRLNEEVDLSYTEFSYVLMQAYDFMWLFQNKNCRLQMGGSDQWGNITAGGELIRKKLRGEVYGLTCPLVTKADGSKFGKTEEGNVWLDARFTSPYKFYQFWLNCSDADAENYLKIFTMLPQEEIKSITGNHAAAPHERLMQKTLAKNVTTLVHSEKDYHAAVEASEILFGNGTEKSLRNLSENDLLSVFEGVPKVNLSKSELESGINVIEFFADKTKIFPSRGEAKKMIQGGGVFINKQKVEDIQKTVDSKSLINSRYILAQKGKKNYFLVVCG